MERRDGAQERDLLRVAEELERDLRLCDIEEAVYDALDEIPAMRVEFEMLSRRDELRDSLERERCCARRVQQEALEAEGLEGSLFYSHSDLRRRLGLGLGVRVS